VLDPIGYSGEVISWSPEVELSIYVGSRLLWDPNEDVEAILTDYFDRMYGEAGEPVRRYFEALTIGTRLEWGNREVTQEDYLPASRNTDGIELWTDERLDAMRHELAAAVASVRTPLSTANVQRLVAYQSVVDAAVDALRAINQTRAGDPPSIQRAELALRRFDEIVAEHASDRVINGSFVSNRLRSLFEEAAKP
jgi:hypothetical protein